MTFADSVLHLVRSGARIDAWSSPDTSAEPEDSGAARAEPLALEGVLPKALPAPTEGLSEAQAPAIEGPADFAEDLHQFEPGLPDLEAAVELVSSGLARRIVLSGFPSWPGLLWRAYQMADTTGVLILPTVVRPGGKVDIVITRDTATNG